MLRQIPSYQLGYHKPEMAAKHGVCAACRGVMLPMLGVLTSPMPSIRTNASLAEVSKLSDIYRGVSLEKESDVTCTTFAAIKIAVAQDRQDGGRAAAEETRKTGYCARRRTLQCEVRTILYYGSREGLPALTQ